MNDLIYGSRIEEQFELDGKNIFDKDVDVVDLRKNVGMVFQKPNPSRFPSSITSLSDPDSTAKRTK